MNGKQSEKSISAPSLSGSVPVALEYIILFGIGIIAMVLHARLRTPLNIPGHHGLEFMALLMAGRTASNIRWASTISSLGIGFILLFPVFGFNDPFMGINYMFPGFIIDILFGSSWRSRYHLLFSAIIAGTAYAAIPLSRLLIHFLTGFPYGSFAKHGYLIPMVGFFVFGMTGGYLGSGFTHSIIKKINRK
ncbi:MAG: hypothetical protein KQI35_15645 [Bacteroidetes bacterium]|nr:hypothetical protein [Bacteroidota bacterium]